jgi:TRAP-type C4-dicarboxylate transport system permease large subunit
VVLVICAIYALGGMLMDALALLLVTLPIFHPVALALGFDPVWFGVVITVVTTMGAITPPVGVNTFIVASMAPEVPMPKVFLGVSLFMSAYLVCVLLLLFFPDLALWLPRFVG